MSCLHRSTLHSKSGRQRVECLSRTFRSQASNSWSRSGSSTVLHAEMPEVFGCLWSQQRRQPALQRGTGCVLLVVYSLSSRVCKHAIGREKTGWVTQKMTDHDRENRVVCLGCGHAGLVFELERGRLEPSGHPVSVE